MLILDQYQHNTSAHRSAATTMSSYNLPAPRLGSHPITMPTTFVFALTKYGHLIGSAFRAVTACDFIFRSGAGTGVSKSTVDGRGINIDVSKLRSNTPYLVPIL